MASRSLSLIRRLFKKHPYWSAIVLCASYLIILQFQFVSSGDSWAEAFYEYVHGAVTHHAGDFFFSRGIAGYFEFLPRTLTLLYIHLGLPLGHIDQFFRGVVIIFTIVCTSYIAHKHNRYLIGSDILRIVLALLTLMTFYHITSFSFINVWYVGFIPIVLISLNPKQFRSEWQQVFYAMFCMAIFLTKPSIILLPLVLYRSVKLKEYLLGFILIFSIGLQTLIFFTSNYYTQAALMTTHSSLFSRAIDTVLYTGLIALKTFRIAPPDLLVVIAACTALVGLLWFLIRSLNVIGAILVALTTLLASYTAIFAPDTPSPPVHKFYKAIFYDQFKLQREVFLAFLILMLIFVAMYHVSRRLPFKIRSFGIFILCVVMACAMFRHIDTRSAGLYIDISPFRKTLTARQPLCMPIPPTPAWDQQAMKNKAKAFPWYYESGDYGTCEHTNYGKIIDYSTNKTIDRGLNIETSSPEGVRPLSAILLPVTNLHPERSSALILEDLHSHQTFKAKITRGQSLVFAAFNLSGDPPDSHYVLSLHEVGKTKSALSLSYFTDGTIAEFAYYAE
jgi:hypothetical protein